MRIRRTGGPDRSPRTRVVLLTNQLAVVVRTGLVASASTRWRPRGRRTCGGSRLAIPRRCPPASTRGRHSSARACGRRCSRDSCRRRASAPRSPPWTKGTSMPQSSIARTRAIARHARLAFIINAAGGAPIVYPAAVIARAPHAAAARAWLAWLRGQHARARCSQRHGFGLPAAGAMTSSTCRSFASRCSWRLPPRP